MSLYEGLMTEVKKGLAGKNGSIPFPVAKMDEYLDIAKNTNYLIVGDTGAGKCLGKGTPVLMYNGTIKKVEEVIEGDKLIGPDSKIRNVISVCTGMEKMYEIIPIKGESFKCNESHILSLKITGTKRKFKISEKLYKSGDIVNISVKEYLKLGKNFKHCSKLWRSPINFIKENSLNIDPYFLGLWLGDGHSDSITITTGDEEIVTYLNRFAGMYGLTAKKNYNSENSYIIRLSNKRGKGNILLKAFQKENLIKNKHIPLKYKQSGTGERLNLLAGIIDSDGHYSNGYYDIILKNEELLDSVIFIARSLGFSANKKKVVKTCTNNNIKGEYFRTTICGNVNRIPCRIKRKQALIRKQKKDVLVTGFTINDIGNGDYYGFEIDKDGLFLLGDFTVTHNTTVSHELMLNILDWYYKYKTEDLLLNIIYLGMERKQYNYSAKWVSRSIFMNEGLYIPVKKILGRLRKRNEKGKLTGEYDKLTVEELGYIEHYAKIFNKWEEDGTFICVEGTHNPTGIKIFIDNFAKKHGKIIEREEGPLEKPKYIPNHPNHIVLIVTDYVGVLDKEKDDQGIKKNRLDIYSSIMRRARDLYGFSPINIQQLSRQVGDVSRLKLNDVKPRLTDIADTSELARDADVVLAIFEAWRYLPQDIETDLIGYNLHKLKDAKGYKYYRSLHILKSSFDGDGITMGCAFHPMTGIIKPMPKNPNDMQDSDYKEITIGQWFLKND